MQIKARVSQYRRDFKAIYVCEFCGYETAESYGYDDANFHNNVIPNMKCNECDKSSGAPSSSPIIPAHVVI